MMRYAVPDLFPTAGGLWAQVLCYLLALCHRRLSCTVSLVGKPGINRQKGAMKWGNSK